MTTYQLGRLAVEFDGWNEFAHHAIEEVAIALPTTTQAPGLRFEFCEDLPASDHTRVGDLLAGENLRVHSQDLLYELNGKTVPDRIKVAWSPSIKDRGWAREFRRFKDWNYLYPEEIVAKNFTYNLFDWATQLANLELGQTYLHASSMAKQGRAVAFLAWGGVGKTTALLKLCIEDGWKYLSDDLGLADESGILYRTPKKLQVYGYNISGERELERRLLLKRARLDALSWHLRLRMKGPNLVRRRVAPEFLFGKDGVASRAKLAQVVFLDKVSRRGCSVDAISSDEMARRMAPIVMSELEPYSTLHRQAEACGIDFFQHPRSVQERTREVLSCALRDAQPFRIKVGVHTPPTVLADTIRAILS